MLQFKIQIKEISKPSVWRKVLVPETFTFHDFHLVIQAAFGWEDYHLYQFSPKGYGSEPQITLPSDDDWGPVVDSLELKLKDVFTQKGQTYIYIYDFGDDWTHEITLEEITDEKALKASCIAGKGACPPEDCGGVWGYEDLKAIFKERPNSDEAFEFREWLFLEEDEIWDANAFDLEEANEEVREV